MWGIVEIGGWSVGRTFGEESFSFRKMGVFGVTLFDTFHLFIERRVGIWNKLFECITMVHAMLKGF